MVRHSKLCLYSIDYRFRYPRSKFPVRPRFWTATPDTQRSRNRATLDPW